MFITELREEMRHEMQALNDALDGDGLPWLEIAPRGPHEAIRLTPLEVVFGAASGVMAGAAGPHRRNNVSRESGRIGNPPRLRGAPAR